MRDPVKTKPDELKAAHAREPGSSQSALRPQSAALSRRRLLQFGAYGLGGLGLLAAAGGGALSQLHHAARAKRVIFLFMGGGPSQFETFDPKPQLTKLWGQPMPHSFTRGERWPNCRARRCSSSGRGKVRAVRARRRGGQ